MPYCPKCDMEFVDGITVCTDCGGPLVESEEAARAMKEKERRERMEQEQALRAEYEEAAAMHAAQSPSEGAADLSGRRAAMRVPSNVYVNKSQKYEEMKSSASAFLCVGAILTVASALMWANVIPLPLQGTARILMLSVLTFMGVGSLIVAMSTMKSSRQMADLAVKEKETTDNIIEEFLSNHTAQSLDQKLAGELDGLSPEEVSLKRLDLIQDLLITSHDISDQTYADSLAEELFEKIYES